MTPEFEVVKVTATRFQVNELRPEGVTFVGIRSTREEADNTVACLRGEYENDPLNTRGVNSGQAE